LLLQGAHDLLRLRLPGDGFGDYKNFIRISACQDEKILIDGMNILSNIMSEKQ